MEENICYLCGYGELPGYTLAEDTAIPGSFWHDSDDERFCFRDPGQNPAYISCDAGHQVPVGTPAWRFERDQHRNLHPAGGDYYRAVGKPFAICTEHLGDFAKGFKLTRWGEDAPANRGKRSSVTDNRRAELARLLATGVEVHTAEQAERFGVGAEAIRRDLLALGAVQRKLQSGLSAWQRRPPV